MFIELIHWFYQGKRLGRVRTISMISSTLLLRLTGKRTGHSDHDEVRLRDSLPLLNPTDSQFWLKNFIIQNCWNIVIYRFLQDYFVFISI